MLPHVLHKDNFERFISFLMSGAKVFAPVARGPNYAFEQIDSPEDIALVRMDYDTTILPPKKCIMPVHEDLLSFGGLEPSSAQAAIAASPTVILGAHPHDVHGIAALDAAMGASPADENYIQRRRSTRVIALNVKQYVDEHQFMADMGTTEPPEGHYDVLLTDLGDRYFAEPGSEEGLDMIKASNCFAAATTGDHRLRQLYDAAKGANLTKRLPYNTRYLPQLLDASYDSLLWDAVARRCFSCGTCTNVCPTCFCFDVQDKLNIDAASGVRRRRWDSCQLRMFAEVAGGENFREHRTSRLRHRIFRKGKYILERFGKLGCVGCGRCARHCVAKISILEAFQQIAYEAEVESEK